MNKKSIDSGVTLWFMIGLVEREEGNAVGNDLLSIGRLAKMASVSVDTVRYYNDIGVLEPAYVSGESGYRYYTAAQVILLEKIKELKAFGFSLNEIKKMLILDEGKLNASFQKRYWELLKEKERLQETIALLAEKINKP